MTRRWSIALGALLLAVLAVRAPAHDLAWDLVRVHLGEPGAPLTLEITAHADAVYANTRVPVPDAARYEWLRARPASWHEQREAFLRDYYRRKLRVLADGNPLETRVRFPARLADISLAAPDTPYFADSVEMQADLPPGSSAIEVEVPASFLQTLVVVLDPAGDEIASVLVARGGGSTGPVALPGAAGAVAPASRGAGSTAWTYLRIGVTHVLPGGVDHMLFVLGLFLLSPRLGALALQVSMFTLAHTLSLALGALGVVSVPAGVVEPLIALSIAFVCVENLLGERATRRRLVVVFVFGLVHGLGFAGVLRDVGLPPGRLVVSLVSFNVGVEIAQLCVVGGAMLLAMPVREKPWYRARVTSPLSVAIAVAGAAWAAARIFS